MTLSLSTRVKPLYSQPVRRGRPRGVVCQSEPRQRSLPRGPSETADQAITAARAAFEDGLTQQRIEFIPPLTGATDLDDWPGGIRQMFTAILPMVERFLVGLKSTEALQCQLQSQMLDDGDAVALWTGTHLKAILFPTADALLKAQSLPPTEPKISLLINPQWRDGQVISDFGFGRRKQDIEALLARFEDTYFLKSYRIFGQDVRVLRCYPGDWQVIVSDPNGIESCIAEEKAQPSYQRIEALLKASGKGTGSVLDRLQQEFDFNLKSLKQP